MEQYQSLVWEWPTPTTRAQIRTFLGKTGYYRRFIPGYAQIAKPLFERLKKTDIRDHDPFPPSPQVEKATQELKERLVQAPILAYPRFDSNEPFILDTDWSLENEAIGAVLSQVQDGHERVIAYGAKRLTKSQRNYPATKGELSAVIHFIRHWRYYLQHRPFVLRTDHKALEWIRTMEAPTGMIQRWLDTLANFQFTIEHRAGPKHTNADALSRAPHAPEMTLQEERDITMGERIGAINPIDSRPLEQTWTVEDWKIAQHQDRDLSDLRRILRERKEPSPEERSRLSPTVLRYLQLGNDVREGPQGLLQAHRAYPLPQDASH